MKKTEHMNRRMTTTQMGTKKSRKTVATKKRPAILGTPRQKPEIKTNQRWKKTMRKIPILLTKTRRPLKVWYVFTIQSHFWTLVAKIITILLSLSVDKEEKRRKKNKLVKVKRKNKINTEEMCRDYTQPVDLSETFGKTLLHLLFLPPSDLQLAMFV